jgi:hypothetical protein
VWSGVRAARQVSACGPRGHRDRALDAPYGLERLDHRRAAPGVHLRSACVFETWHACGLCGDGLAICLNDQWWRWGGQTTARSQRRWAGRPWARPVERILCRSTKALSRHVASFSCCRVSARARLRSRLAASSTAGPYPGVRSPARLRRANGRASRRSVVTRSPGGLGSQAGATTQQPSPLFVRSRARQKSQGSAAWTQTRGGPCYCRGRSC